MGLFSFIKNAGKKVFGKKGQGVPAEKKVSREELLAKEVTDLGLKVDGLHIALAQQVIVTGSTDTSAEREKVVLALGNVDGVGAVEDLINVRNPEPGSRFHTVVSGDTLSKISKAVYGDPMKYNAIFEANKPMLDHPDKIYPGQILRIPNL